MFSRTEAAIARAARPATFFFRDDDADRDIPELRRLLELFGNAGVPLSLAVIPATLTADAARLLAGSGCELHQHGWTHINHEPEGARKCEFGPARSAAQQREDIVRGRQRLAELLGRASRPLFTPPWNRCAAATYAALADLGFAAISRDASPRPVEMPCLTEVPVSVDLFRWKRGAALKSPDELDDEIAAWLARDGAEPIGVLLHHKVMTPAAFEWTQRLLDCLAAAGSRVRFTTIEEAALVCDKRS